MMNRICFQVFDQFNRVVVASSYEEAAAIGFARALNTLAVVPRYCVSQAIIVAGEAV